MNVGLKRALHWIGGALALASVAFVVLRLRDAAGEVDFARLGVGALSALLALSTLYAASNLLLALAWWRILRASRVDVRRGWAVRAYGASQLAKYVPGNVFQFAGRQAIGLAAGLPGAPLARSVLWELGLLGVAGAHFGLLVLPRVDAGLGLVHVVPLFLIVGAAVTLLMRRRLGADVAGAFGLHAAFLALSGLIFTGTFFAVSGGEAGAPVIGLSAAYVVAWLAGLVTPGAPAGLGVREAVLLGLLGGAVDEGSLLMATIVGRAVTVLGDTVFFALTSLLGERLGEAHA